MTEIILETEPLTTQGFAAYGDVIDTGGADHFSINDGTMERFHDLAQVDIADADDDVGRPLISIVSCNRPSASPHRITTLERHPLGSQAFIPLSKTTMVVVVAPPGDAPDLNKLAAFHSNGRQGINYARGVWHMPLIAGAPGLRFVVVDRGGKKKNCDEVYLGAQAVYVRY